MPVETMRKLAESDAYVASLIREVETLPATTRAEIGRRGFIKLAAAGGAGLVLAFHVPGKGALAADAPKVINAFVRIAPDNTVTIYSKGPEIGQGIKTAFGLIIAEELDADWKHVVVEQARVNPKVYGYQGAGGSTSIPRGWDQLRQAGAGAKAMLIAAAAKNWNVPVSECAAQDSTVNHKASGKTATYGSLAEAAAKLVANIASLGSATPAWTIPRSSPASLCSVSMCRCQVWSMPITPNARRWAARSQASTKPKSARCQV